MQKQTITRNSLKHLFKEKQTEFKLKYNGATSDQIKITYNNLKKDIDIYKKQVNFRTFSNYTLKEMYIIYWFFRLFNSDLKKFEHMDWSDKESCMNLISGVFSYKAVLDELLLRNILKGIGEDKNDKALFW